MFSFTIKNIEELEEVSNQIIELTSTNTVFCFYGNLGAGKTTLIKLICEKLNVTDSISSPTYPIINEYKTADNNIIYHIDLYRLKSIEEAMNIGIEDYLFSDYLCFIEWPDNFESILPDNHIKIKITKFDDYREIVISNK
ncbi:MAG TPA: tRNA (adenosine(37)-N6)-threonylcarbamoyltransferase complex ATPase subunit type 1 TsaE [Chitinophagales bacterium]|nr:tRNA (adenosine(37)-N6)-threonylcarbamoyltransferase complex ATPase subunit type 1 TsaE [Chitinophagales bacterium]